MTEFDIKSIHNVKHFIATAKCPFCGHWSHINQYQKYGFNNREPEIRIYYVQGLGRGRGFNNVLILEGAGYERTLTDIKNWFKVKIKQIFSSKEEIWKEKFIQIVADSSMSSGTGRNSFLTPNQVQINQPVVSKSSVVHQ